MSKTYTVRISVSVSAQDYGSSIVLRERRESCRGDLLDVSNLVQKIGTQAVNNVSAQCEVIHDTGDDE